MTVLERPVTERNGYHIDHMAEVDVKTITATINESEKVEFQGGKLAVDWLSDSYKYGSEIQIVYYTKTPPVVKSRVDGHNGWHRVEIHLTPDAALQVVRSLK